MNLKRHYFVSESVGTKRGLEMIGYISSLGLSCWTSRKLKILNSWNWATERPQLSETENETAKQTCFLCLKTDNL